MSSFADGLSRLASTPGFKFFLVGALILLLAVPMLFVWLLIEDRSDRADQVAREVASSWGGRQVITGPYLIVPFTRSETEVVDGQTVIREVRSYRILLPETLTVDVDAQSQELRRSIFRVPVYRADVAFDAEFAAMSADAIASDGDRLDLENAVLAMTVSDVRAFRAPVALQLDGRGERMFEPSLGLFADASTRSSSGHGAFNMESGIHVRLGTGAANQPIKARFTLDIAGSDSLLLAPGARETVVSMVSDWPHPSFTGSFLPTSREISGTGFEASWQVPHLARSVPTTWEWGEGGINALSNASFGVRFFQPVDVYQITDRALKYALMFIAVAFLTVFAVEMSSDVSIHSVQYIFVGLALLVFYVLLLALAEQIGFLWAYIAAATATSLLVAVYIAGVIADRMRALMVFGFLLVLFAFLYLVLRLEDYAFLAGAVFGFVVLATVMLVTRRVDWSSSAKARSPA